MGLLVDGWRGKRWGVGARNAEFDFGGLGEEEAE